MDGLGEFFLDPLCITDMGSIDDAPKNLQHWSPCLWDAYLKKVAKHQRYLAGEERSDLDSPTPKSAKTTKKSKPSAPKATPVTKPVAAKASKSTSSQQPKPAPTKTQEKKGKRVTETSDKLSPAKSSKSGLVTKRRKPTRSLSLVDEFVDEEADMQRAVEESLKSVHDAPRGDSRGTASSTGTLSSLQHLAKDFSFGNLFFNDKPSEAEIEKETVETKAESMVSITIQQDTSAIPPMTTPRINELEHIMVNLIQDNKHLEERLDSHGARLYTLENLNIPQQVSKAVDEIVTDAVVHLDLQDHLELLDHHKCRLHLIHLHPPIKKTTNDIRLRLFVLSILEDLHMDDDMAPDAQAHSSDNEDIRNAHIPMTGDMAMFMDWFFKRQGITKLKPQDLEGLVFELVKDLEYLRYGSKGSRPTLSISNMKVAYYLDVGLEQMVPDQMWIEEECTIEGFSMYGYDYMKKIVLCRVDLNEHIIAKSDFKYMYPSDFEDLYLLNLQGHLNHLPPKDKKILTTAVNL
nr:hypothetical protein [Tanacetum cinerariifolium]